jgi:hypothetical protein
VSTLDDVFRKFGESAEAAQLLETELGTMLLLIRGTEEKLITEPNPTSHRASRHNQSAHSGSATQAP